jgi:hypothetical protein
LRAKRTSDLLEKSSGSNTIGAISEPEIKKFKPRNEDNFRKNVGGGEVIAIFRLGKIFSNPRLTSAD